eukprot:scaffold2562_cov354-Prasinococcus_capsulatus_cf.AAC.4
MLPQAPVFPAHQASPGQAVPWEEKLLPLRPSAQMPRPQLRSWSLDLMWARVCMSREVAAVPSSSELLRGEAWA